MRTPALLIHRLAPILAGTLLAAQAPAETVWLDALDLSPIRQGWGKPLKNQAIRETPLTIAGARFDRGVGTHAVSWIWVELDGRASRFTARVGLDDAAGKGSIVFQAVADGRVLFDSGVMKTGDAAKLVDLDLKDAKLLLLQVRDGGDGIEFDHANWAEAKFEVAGAPPRIVPGPREEAVILTPKPTAEPRINGPKVYGCRPGNPFLYRIPVQGERPIRFTTKGLPKGLSLDSESGFITGKAPAPGQYVVTLRARNEFGESTRVFRIVAGETLALTPPMGWNHWYAHYDRVTYQTVRAAAEAMITNGMADVGYQYVNIDDCWMNAPKHADPMRVGPARDSLGRLLPNKYFPDMAGLAGHIHQLGLKAGLYSSPGPLTCAGFAGSFGHEAIDAATFAEWGYDFLKYDWCSYNHLASGGDPKATNIPTWGKGATNLVAYQHPYQLMGRLLQERRRDIVFNLCQYGMANVWEWGRKVGGHCWRTSGDLGFELDRIFEVALKNAEYRQWSRPGAWNDPDYLQIGWIGNARGNGLPEPCPLSPNEQYAYMSLWVLMAAPLFYSGDMAKLDPFTLNILCNPEVIDIDQDALGQCAKVTHLGPDTFLMVKDLEDGKAVGLFNRGQFPAPAAALWTTLGVSGPQTVRDVWRHSDLGVFDKEYGATVPRRGSLLLKLTPARPGKT